MNLKLNRSQGGEKQDCQKGRVCKPQKGMTHPPHFKELYAYRRPLNVIIAKGPKSSINRKREIETRKSHIKHIKFYMTQSTRTYSKNQRQIEKAPQKGPKQHVQLMDAWACHINCISWFPPFFYCMNICIQ